MGQHRIIPGATAPGMILVRLLALTANGRGVASGDDYSGVMFPDRVGRSHSAGRHGRAEADMAIEE